MPLKNQTFETTMQSAGENADLIQGEDMSKSLTRVEDGIVGAGRHQTPETPAAERSAKLPSWNAVKTLAIFLLFRVVLPACDVVTDLATGFSLCQRGHIRWGVVTLVLIFCPFLAGLVKYLVKKMWPYYFEDPDALHKTKFTKEAAWLLPLVQPFV